MASQNFLTLVQMFLVHITMIIHILNLSSKKNMIILHRLFPREHNDIANLMHHYVVEFYDIKESYLIDYIYPTSLGVDFVTFVLPKNITNSSLILIFPPINKGTGPKLKFIMSFFF